MTTVDGSVLHEDFELSRSALGDRTAAEAVFKRLNSKLSDVIRLASRSNRQQADLQQNVALEFVQSLRNYRGSGSLEAWAGSLAYRVTKRSIKKMWDWENVHVSGVDHDIVEYTTPESNTLKQELMDALLEKMREMPKKRRVPIVLHLVHGYSVNEVSDIMGVSPNTTKDRLKLGLRELRSIFDQYPSLRETMLELIR